MSSVSSPLLVINSTEVIYTPQWKNMRIHRHASTTCCVHSGRYFLQQMWEDMLYKLLSTTEVFRKMAQSQKMMFENPCPNVKAECVLLNFQQDSDVGGWDKYICVLWLSTTPYLLKQISSKNH